MNIDLSISTKQEEFINVKADEVLFGGAAGGGKSFGQLIDTMLYALEYPCSKQLILRRTFPELEKSLIRVHLGLYPREIYTYNSSNHTGKFRNGSIIDFGYCDSEKDVYKYQSAEYDVIRFDELTHFTEQMYIYLLSRIRGANNNPKMAKSSTNPGGVGHTWVKSRFIDIGEPNVVHKVGKTTRVFIPSKIQDNKFLLDADPDYINRLENLSERDQRALIDGDWDIFDGQYFNEFNRDVHVIEPFEIPEHWRRYVAMDYGMDMLAVLWMARDTEGNSYVYKEAYKSGLIIAEAADEINRVNNGDKYQFIYAPRDLWNSRQETGKSVSDIFFEKGIRLSKTSVDRVDGWMATKEWLHVIDNRDIETGESIKTSKLKIFRNCINLIRCLPTVQIDDKNPNDVATEPHELTHICVVGNTKIRTTKGEKEIKDITIGEKVYCYDFKNNKITTSLVEMQGMTNPNAPILRIEFENGYKLEGTPEHKILTNDGWKMLKELNINDEVLELS